MDDRAKAVLSAVPGLVPLTRAWRRRRYERTIRRFVAAGDGRADRFPRGIVYEATMRCNLRCEFCYVGDLLNVEGQWRQELGLDVLERAFPRRSGLEVSLTGGEVFVRKDIGDVMDLFRRKGYVCGYLTTNGTLIDDARARALADLARAGFLKHVSVSVDGPPGLHDSARGVKGTFDRTAAGLRRLRAAAAETGAPLRVSINTTISGDSLEALDRMADVAQELGVDAIGVNHLMFATPDEVADSARLLGVADRSVITTYVATGPALSPSDVQVKLGRLAATCRLRGIRFDVRPKVHAGIIERYYTAGAPLDGRCLYPFMHARVGFSGKVSFCPFIRIEVGDLSRSSLEEIWNGDAYVQLRRRLLEHRLFPVCRRCCKVELERAC
jgi:MoaA/NifB/PqqE/SkfB family radical SAM enzyme